MPIWYNEPAKDSKYASLAVSDWEQINSKVVFKEVGIVESDEFFYLFGQAEEVTDVKFMNGGKDWQFKPQLVSLKIARKDYTKWDSKERKNIPASQSKLEKLFCSALQALDLEEVYKGKLWLQVSPQTEMLLTKTGFDNEPLSDQLFNSLLSGFIHLTVVDAPEIIKIDELEAPKKASWSGKSAGQLEYDKCSDRLKFFCEQLKTVFPNTELTNLADINKLQNNPEHSAKFFEILPILSNFIGGNA